MLHSCKYLQLLHEKIHRNVQPDPSNLSFAFLSLGGTTVSVYKIFATFLWPNRIHTLFLTERWTGAAANNSTSRNASVLVSNRNPARAVYSSALEEFRLSLHLGFHPKWGNSYQTWRLLGLFPTECSNTAALLATYVEEQLEGKLVLAVIPHFMFLKWFATN